MMMVGFVGWREEETPKLCYIMLSVQWLKPTKSVAINNFHKLQESFTLQIGTVSSSFFEPDPSLLKHLSPRYQPPRHGK